MGTIVRWICNFTRSLLVFMFLFAPCIAILFVLSLVLAGIAGWGFGIAGAAAYTSIGWKIYLGLGIFALILTMPNFRENLKYHRWKESAKDTLGLVAWPWRLSQFFLAKAV